MIQYVLIFSLHFISWKSSWYSIHHRLFGARLICKWHLSFIYTLLPFGYLILCRGRSVLILNDTRANELRSMNVLEKTLPNQAKAQVNKISKYVGFCAVFFSSKSWLFRTIFHNENVDFVRFLQIAGCEFCDVASHHHVIQCLCVCI